MSTSPPCFVLYRDGRGEWRWTLYAANSRKIADSAEGYQDRAKALHGIALVKQLAPTVDAWDGTTKQWVSTLG